MSRKLSLAVLMLAAGMMAGLALSHITNSQSVYAQESERLLVKATVEPFQG